MDNVRPAYEPDRREWHLDKTLNLTHLFTTMIIAGSLFVYASNMDRRITILEEKSQAQAMAAAKSSLEVRDLASDVKHELRLLRADLMRIVSHTNSKNEDRNE